MTNDIGNDGDELRLRPVGLPALGPFVVRGDGPTVLGRSQSCGVCIPDPSVSRAHAAFERIHDRWFVRDLGSRHGTHLNGMRLEPEVPQPTAAGDLLRLGPHTFRVDLGGRLDDTTFATTAGDTIEETLVEAVHPRELTSLALRRLELLIDGATAVNRAVEEKDLAEAILALAIEGTGFPRAALLRPAGDPGRYEVTASRDMAPGAREEFTFSRSLLAEAAQGRVARLSRTADWVPGQSIERLGITCALCAPITLDGVIISHLYVDARGSEEPGHGDAGGFLSAVARLAGLALANVKRGELLRRQRTLDRDLDAARQAQRFLLPSLEADVGCVRYAMQTHPGRVIAGDLFDIFTIRKDRVAVCVGDVAGQGLAAALVMTAVLAHLRAALVRYGDPSRAVGDVNRYICTRSAAGVFVTLWVGILDPAEGCLQFVDAGHGHCVLRRRGQPLSAPVRPGNMVVGVEPEVTFAVERLEVSAGDRIILYSDGIVEHRSPEGVEFGQQRLHDALAPATSPAEDVHAALGALRAHIGPGSLADDTTFASIEVL